MDEGFKAVFTVTETWCNLLSDAELAGLNLTTALGNDPRNLPCYEKVSGMFEEEYDPPRMHEMTARAVAMIAEQRVFGGE